MTVTPQLVQTFQQVIASEIAGLPNDDQTRWVGLHPGQIRDKMAHEGVEISRYIASELLAFYGFRKRRYSKTQCVGRPADREAQFQKLHDFGRYLPPVDCPF